MTEAYSGGGPYPPAVPGIRVVARSSPPGRDLAGHGRWAEVIPLAKGRAALSAGAVDATGDPARQISDRLRAAGRVCAGEELMSATALSALDATLQVAASGTTATAVYAVHDSVSGSLELSSAGPCPAAVVTPAGSTNLLSSPRGAPLGVASRGYEAVSIPFPEGSSLVLCLHTVACPSSPPSAEVLVGEIGEARLFARGRMSAGRVCAALAVSLGCGREDHDTTVLIAQPCDEHDLESPGRWFPARPESAAAARAFTLRVMDEWDLADRANRANVIVGELAANAIRHSAAPFEVRMQRTETTMTIEVTDQSADPPHPAPAGPFDAGHRGLTIVEALADRWGTRPAGSGKVVWAELRLS